MKKPEKIRKELGRWNASPVPADFDGVNCRNRKPQTASNFGLTNIVFNQKLNCFYRDFIQLRVSILFSFVNFMFNYVKCVFLWCSISEIFNRVVVSISIYMSYYLSLWSRPKKCFSHKTMNGSGPLYFVLRSFPKGNAQVVCGRVLFSNEPFSVFYYRNSSKIANLVNSFVANDRHPNLRCFGHV